MCVCEHVCAYLVCGSSVGGYQEEKGGSCNKRIEYIAVLKE